MSRRSVSSTTSLTAELPEAYLALTFVLFRILPLALLVRLSLRLPSAWSVFLTAGALVALESWHMLHEGHNRG